MHIPLEHSYAENLPGFFEDCPPVPCRAPALVYFNAALADELGLDLQSMGEAALAQLLAGNQLPANARPIAQAYAGHQFGQFNPQLGDGRALLIGEVLDTRGQRIDLCLKGSGQTPYSRGGDGRAALGPMLREVLIAEAMDGLGIPTTRSLAVVTTGEAVYRENRLPGAVLVRTASSHIRIGTFQFFAARQQHDKVKLLADYSISRHYPNLASSDNPYLGLLDAVARRQSALIAQWMSVGFIHGVMNTDNMTIAGETIDYGPCAFMERYDPAAVFSSIDHGGRYAYQNQPPIALWNLTRFAETLLPLIDDDTDRAVELATARLNTFGADYQRDWLGAMRNKLGLQQQDESLASGDVALIERWLNLLEQQQVDFTQAFSALSQVDTRPGGLASSDGPLLALFTDSKPVENWLEQWAQRCALEDGGDLGASAERQQQMRSHNPWLIPRNHQVEAALHAATVEADYSPFETLLDALRSPFSVQAGREALAEPASEAFTRGYQTFCGT